MLILTSTPPRPTKHMASTTATGVRSVTVAGCMLCCCHSCCTRTVYPRHDPGLGTALEDVHPLVHCAYHAAG